MTHTRNLLIDLVTRQLPAFTGLGALRHLDLDIVRVDQVLVGHPETPRRNLFDRRSLGIHRTIGQRIEAVRLRAAFTGVRLAADRVHRPGERRVGLVGDRAE